MFVGRAGTPDCLFLFTEFRILCREFGVPLAEEKSVYPTSCLDFLGIQIDTVAMEFRLPVDKVLRIQALLVFVMSRRKVRLKFLQSLLGLLAFASRIMPMGRVFTKRLYRAISGITYQSHFVRITSALVADLRVWLDFLRTFNGCSLWQFSFLPASALKFFTDAAGSCGYESWKSKGLTNNIVLLELFPILVALDLWGSQLINRRILIHSDNKGVVYAINCLSSKSLPVISILREIVFRCLTFNIWLQATYIAGVENVIADCLSRSQIPEFRRLVPNADPVGLVCPPHLWSMV